MKGEIWKDIAGFEGKYQVSNTGKVKSLERTVWNGKGYYKIPEKILEGYDNGYGYLCVKLCKEGKRKQYRINRLVAQAFLENPQNLPEVNHKDENKYNNCVENLEYCNRSYNINYGTGNKRRAKKLAEKVAEELRNDLKRSKPVIGINKVSGLILEFPSLMEAERQTGIANSNICACLKGRYKSAGGYTWHYAESEEVANEQE